MSQVNVLPDVIARAADAYGTACDSYGVTRSWRADEARAHLDALILDAIGKPSLADIAAVLTSEEVAKKALMAFWEYDANGDIDDALRVAAEAILKMEVKS